MASFSTAFAAARKAGVKTFTWNGKSYNTKLAKTGTPAKMKAPGSRPVRLPETVKAPGSRPEKTTSIKEGIAKAAQKSGASRSTKGKTSASLGGPELTIGNRISRAVRVGKTAVERGRRRDAAAAANKGAGKAVRKMLDGMGTRPKKKK